MIFSADQIKKLADLKTKLESTQSLLQQAWYLPEDPYTFKSDKVLCQNNIDEILGKVRSIIDDPKTDYDDTFIDVFNTSIDFFKRGESKGGQWHAMRP